MAHPTNEPGFTGQGPSGGSAPQGGSGEQGFPRPVGGMGARPAPGAAASAHERAPQERVHSAGMSGTRAAQAERQYSFHALVAVGVLGFVLGRLFSR